MSALQARRMRWALARLKRVDGAMAQVALLTVAACAAPPTSKDLSALTGRAVSTVRRACGELERRGLLVRHTFGRPGTSAWGLPDGAGEWP